MLLLALACAHEAPPPPPVAADASPPAVADAPTAPAAPAVPTSGALATPESPKGDGPCAGLEAALWPLTTSAEPVQVNVDVAGVVALPASFAEEARGPGMVQGTVPGTDLCALAALEHVVRVRQPLRARPK